MMNANELRSADDIYDVLVNNWHDNDVTMLPPMFHGTDASLVNCTVTERDQLNNACEIIINAMTELYEVNMVDQYDERLLYCRDSYGRTSTAFIFAKERAKQNSLYSYGSFYVSNNPKIAIDYSQEAWIFGETGWIANRLLEGAKVLGLELPSDDDFKTAFQLIDSRRQTEKRPVVMMIINGDSSALDNERGMNLKDFWGDDFPDTIQDIKDQMSSIDSYRLSNQDSLDNLTFYIITKDYYRNLLKAWNDLAMSRWRY